MKAIILDTETTDATDEREMIEVAYVPVTLGGRTAITRDGHSFEQRYKPSKPITYGAMATHHILPSDIEGCPPPNTFVFPSGVEYLIGHKIDFDWETIGRPDVKRICTLAIARRLWPNDSHTLSALMYQFSHDLEDTRLELRDAHSAMADVYFCKRLLNNILDVTDDITTLEELYEFSEACRIPTHMTFGKHNGTAISDLPIDYVGWFLGQSDVDPYLRKAFEARVAAEREKRGLPRRAPVANPFAA